MDSNQHLQITIDRINDLAYNDEEDEYGCITTVTADTIERAIVLVSAAAQLCTKFLKAWVSIEDSGGIYLTWCHPISARSLRLLLPGNSQTNSYIYYEENDEYDLQTNINSKDLSKWIDWVNANPN